MNDPTNPGRFIAACLAAFLSATPAWSGDGRLEINQACALEGGCFEGDDPGFPVQITQSGSYRLTGNLDVTVASDPPNTTAIEIDADGTFLDLNGKTIRGPVDCTGSMPVQPSDCSPTGSGMGISSSSRASIRDGSIVGMGANGVDSAGHMEIRSLYLRFNGEDGLEIGDGSVVRSVRAVLNGDDGIDVQSTVAGATIVNTVSFGNGATGFRLGPGSVVRSSNVYVNREDGVLMSGGASTVIDSASRNNNGDGIDCGSEGAIKGNVVAGNLDTATRNCAETGTNFCDGDTNCPQAD